jgi:amylosucrase
VHRISVNDESIQRAKIKGSPELAISSGLKKLIAIRKSEPLFGAGNTTILQTNNEHVFAYSRETKTEAMHAVCNFSEHLQHIDAKLLGVGDQRPQDLISKQKLELSAGSITLAPYQVLWLK